MSVILTKAKEIYVSLRGFHTKRHLVVIESDDWGSIRMPSYKTFKQLQQGGDHPEKDGFLSYDCLERTKELHDLFTVLNSVRDSKGNPAIMTANFAMANPDFQHIDYDKGIYAYEPFFETYKRYYPDEDVLSEVKRGMQEGYFYPQLHCREHLNVNRWMKDLKKHKDDVISAFGYHMIGIGASFTDNNRFGYMDAFNTECSSNEKLAEILEDAANIFEQTFGFCSESFVASCFVWNDALEIKLKKLGIQGIQSAMWQNVPVGTNDKYKLKRRIRYAGQKNTYGQCYNIRNCSFEPAYLQNPKECANKCYEQILHAFKSGKPAVINSHRFNYIGSINSNNAENNLSALKQLLERLVKEVPDVEFVSTPDLIKIMKRK